MANDPFNGDYSSLSGLQSTLTQNLPGSYNNEGNKKAYTNELTQAGQAFNSQFTNMVGRAPTQDELNQFYTQFASQNKDLTNPGQYVPLQQGIQSFVGSNFGNAAKDYATQQLTDQQTQAQGLADQYRSLGNSTINGTEQSLLDYQSKLFDRLRPNLITSLKSQGLLDTGGFNEAVAGVQGDLANNASQYVAGLRQQNNSQANDIAFGGAYAPYSYKQALITGQPQELSQVGGLANNFSNSLYMNNLDYAHQLGLMGASYAQTPGFMKNFTNNLGAGLGNQISQWAGPGAYSSSGGSGGSGTSAAAGLKMLL